MVHYRPRRSFLLAGAWQTVLAAQAGPRFIWYNNKSPLASQHDRKNNKLNERLYLGFTTSILSKSHPDVRDVNPTTSDCESILPDLVQIKVTTGAASADLSVFVFTGSSGPLMFSSMLKIWGGGGSPVRLQRSARSSMILKKGQSLHCCKWSIFN